MKFPKLFYIGLLLTLILPQTLFAQAPDGVNYQAVVRNSLGLPLNNQAVSVRFTIHQGSPTGASVFQEIQPTSTNQFGLINLELGSVNNGAFSAINWGTGGAYYLQIEVDAGSGYDDLGASQLLSVPYALFARSAATGAQGFNSLLDTVGAGASCPNGGYEVLMGLDANANTVLDAGEVSSSFFVCNGSIGLSINWQGSFSATPVGNPNDAYYNSADGVSYIFNGTTLVWDTLAAGGAGAPDNDWIIAGPNMSSGLLGNVGIGTLLPTRKLSIQTGAAGGDGIQINNAAAGNPGIEYQTQGTSRFVMGIDQSDNNKFKIGTTGVNTNTRFTIDGQGLVGVGTINPNQQLSVLSADSLIASFTSTNTDVAAISIVGTNPNSAVGIVMLSGADSGMIAIDPANKTLWFSHSTAGGHTGIYADSAVALYGDVIGNISRSTIINQADSIFNVPISSNLINVNQGTFFTDSLYVLGNNLFNPNWVLANDGLGQAVWTDPTTLPGGGGAWTSNGTETFLNSVNDNVGIGIAAPTSKLHVVDNISLTPEVLLETTAGNFNIGYRYRTALSEWFMGQGMATGQQFRIADVTSGTVPFVIEQTGNVGFGTTTPLTQVHIADAAQTTLAIQASHNGLADQASTLTLVRSRGSVTVPLAVNSGDRLGKIEFNGWDGGTFAESASIRAIADDPFGAAAHGTHLEFYTTTIGTIGTVERMRILDNGFIGIGTTSPISKVHIANGTLTIDDGGTSYTFPPSDGTVNQVLTTNGTGSVTWQTPAATTSSRIEDVGNNTFIEVDALGTGVEDIIHFSTNGVEHFNMNNGRLNTLNPGNGVFIGENAGLNDNLGGLNMNVAVGEDALRSNITGKANTAIGTGALQNTDAVDQNTAIGYLSMNLNTTGGSNVAIGSSALSSNSTGSVNVAIGSLAMSSNTTGGDNVAIGDRSLQANTTAAANVAVGQFAMNAHVTGNFNTAIGTNALRLNSSGFNNTSLGTGAGYSNVVGTSNVFIGYEAGYFELGSNKLYIDNSNTATPLIWGDFAANVLQVNGSLNINGNYTLPTIDGAANQILTTDGAGNVTWQIPPATPASPWTKVGSDVFQTTLTDFVGVGTNAPTEMLSVGSLGTATSVAFQQSSNRLALTGSYWNGSAVAHDFTLSNEASTVVAEEGRLAIGWSGSGAELVSITSTGRLGIGLTTPEFPLDVNGAISLRTTGIPTGSAGRARIWYDGGKLFGRQGGSAGYELLSGWTISGVNTVLGANTTGNVGIGTTTPGQKLTVRAGGSGTIVAVENSGGALRHDIKINGLDNAVYQMSNNAAVQQIQLNTGGPSFFNGGDLGIGTATPISKLDVLGQITMSDGSEGVGKVLVSDVNGTATWKDKNIAFEAYATAVQPVAIGVFGSPVNLVNYNAVIFNDGGNYNSVAGFNQFNAPVNGVYVIQASVTYDYSAGGPNETIHLGLMKNGSPVPIRAVATSVTPFELGYASISVTVQLNAGDIIQVETVKAGGAVVNILPNEKNWFSGHLVYAY